MTPIDVLPDDVLLVTFDFYIRISTGGRGIEAWQSLVHVCRRWRCLVFGSPRHLNLQLFCAPETPARDALDVWPALPLIVRGYMTLSSVTDNIIAALGQRNRVCQVYLSPIAGWQLEEVLAVMQVPFPELTELVLRLSSDDGPLPVIPDSVIPDSFLGGSAPRLRSFGLSGISFPGLPNLLLSVPHLVKLRLFDIPHSGYISPEAMATCLSVLTSLDTFFLGFRFYFPRSRSRPDRGNRHSPPMTRSILPGLSTIMFKGTSEYMDDLVARIDAPRLDELSITFYPQINFDTPHLVQFISRTPRFQEPNEAHVNLNPDAEVQLVWASDGHGSRLSVEIFCEESVPHPSSIAQVYPMCSPSLLTVENLLLGGLADPVLEYKHDIKNDQWLELLRPFTAVKSLY